MTIFIQEVKGQNSGNVDTVIRLDKSHGEQNSISLLFDNEKYQFWKDNGFLEKDRKDVFSKLSDFFYEEIRDNIAEENNGYDIIDELHKKLSPIISGFAKQ